LNLPPNERISKTEQLYRAIWENEAPSLLGAKDHPEFLDAIERLIQESDFDEEGNLEKIIPLDLRKQKNDTVRAMAHILLLKETHHRKITGQLAKVLKSQLEKDDKTTKVPLLFSSYDINTGTSKDLLLKLCWISYALGCRAVHQVNHTKTMELLPDLFRGISMNPQGRDLSNRKGQNRNQNLKNWFFQSAQLWKQNFPYYRERRALRPLSKGE